ncbi:MAG: enoyl-CoA hydratase/isomerase family protein [Planctomycetota bacterium]|jgi:methylglutaconyl-CoA hydratase
MTRDTVRLTRQGAVARVALDRPDVRNAFNDEMLEDLLEAFAAIRDDAAIRVAVLTGEGNCFCAGADVNWMKRVVNYTQEENYQDSLRLARMLRDIYDCPKPVIGRINGPAIGGGTGLVAVCDIAIAAEDAVFGITETKLGVIPAAISPYLLKRMGERNLKEYTLTGERFKAPRAAELGLINSAVPPDGLDRAVEARIEMIMAGGPEALTASKQLIRDVAERSLDDAGPYTAKAITERRMSDEGQEGMNAFLRKEKPRWVADAKKSPAR